MTQKTLLIKAQKRPGDETGRANRTQGPVLSLQMEHCDGEVRGPALLSSTTLRQRAILLPILGAMVGGCATLKGGGYQEAQVEQEATVIYLQRSLESYLSDSTLVAETRSTMQDSWHTFKNTLDAVLQSMPELDTIPAVIDSMRVATETREDAWRAASATMETNALAVNRADSAHLTSYFQYEYQLVSAAGDRSALDAAWARHAPSLQAYQASFDTLMASVLAADSAELNWHAAYIDYVKVVGAVSVSSADVTARLAMSMLNENAYDAARASYTRARDGWKISAWRYHVFAKERQLAAKTQVAMNDQVTFGGVLRAAGGAVLVAGATAGAVMGDVATTTSLVASAEEMFYGSEAAREEDAKAANYQLARAERQAAADRGATNAELMAGDVAVVAAGDEWRAATENALQEHIARREAVMAANLQAQEDMLRELQDEVERQQQAEIERQQQAEAERQQQAEELAQSRAAIPDEREPTTQWHVLCRASWQQYYVEAKSTRYYNFHGGGVVSFPADMDKNEVETMVDFYVSTDWSRYVEDQFGHLDGYSGSTGYFDPCGAFSSTAEMQNGLRNWGRRIRDLGKGSSNFVPGWKPRQTWE